MSNPENDEAAAVPDHVTELRAVFGPPSDAGFGSAVFFQPELVADDLEEAALDTYRRFVGRGWTESREAAWMGVWKLVYERGADDRHDIVAELRAIEDAGARSWAMTMLDAIDDPEKARSTLAAAMDDATVRRLAVYNLGDGEALSGLLVAAQRDDGAATFLVFLMD